MKSVLQGVLLVLLLSACGEKAGIVTTGGDAVRGKEAILRYGCIACHVIPEVPGPASNVGPPLHQFARRAYVGGVVPNRPEALIRWLVDPPGVDPRTAMPAMGVTKAEAADIAAYLYTLD